jgi:hypothetical protein
MRICPSTVIAAAWLTGDDQRMADDPAPYVERYRFTPGIAGSILGCLVFIALAVLTGAPLILEIPVIAVFGWFALYSAATVVSRRIAFCVDERGVTLGGGAFRYNSTTRFFPWEEIAAITLWQRYFPFTIGRWTLFTMGPVRYVGLRRHAGARAITTAGHGRADGPAYMAPMAGIAVGAARNITAWVLDQDRLSEALAAFASTVPIESGAATSRPASSRRAS